MKLCITTRFASAAESRAEIEALCQAVRAAGMEDFVFVRDIEHYEHTFDNPRELWTCAKEEIGKCDGLLVDVTDKPTGGRVVEAGIAFALGLPIFVIVKSGTPYKQIYDGIATKVIAYRQFTDITPQLREYAGAKNNG